MGSREGIETHEHETVPSHPPPLRKVEALLTRLALLFVGVPLLELLLLIQVGQWMGMWPTVGLVILTGVVGAALARMEGSRTLWKIQEELSRGRLPGESLLDGMAILLGGALLLTPGILTDLVGFSFILPPTRRLLLGRIRKSLEGRLQEGTIRVTHMSGFGGFGASPRGPGQGRGEPSGPRESVPDEEGGSGDPTFRPGTRPGEIVVEKEEPGKE